MIRALKLHVDWIRLVTFLVAIVIVGVTLIEYYSVFNADTHVHGLILPSSMAEQKKIFLQDFPYSNNDHRTLYISLFHVPAALLSPDNPWAIYIYGSLAISAVFLFTWSHALKRLNVGYITSFLLLCYLALSPSRRYFEHMHGQNSYLLTSVFLIGALTCFYKVFSHDSFAVQAKTTLVEGKTSQKSALYRRPLFLAFIALFLFVALDIIANLNRGLLTLVVPILSSLLAAYIFTLKKPKKSVIQSILLVLAALFIGTLIYKLITLNIYYTMGAARPFRFENFDGQVQAVFDVFKAFSQVTLWYQPGGFAPFHIRNLSASVIILYLIYRALTTFFARKNNYDLFLVLFCLASISLLSVGINFSDISIAPRYTLSIMMALLFTAVYFTANESGWKKLIVPIALFGLTLDAGMYANVRHESTPSHAERNQAIISFLDENDVDVGITGWGYAGILALEYGTTSFIRAAFSKDGNIRQLPFHSQSYFRGDTLSTKTAFVFNPDDRLIAADEAQLIQAFEAHNLKLIDQKTIVHASNRKTTIYIIDGDIRSLFISPSLTNNTNYIVFNDQSRIGGGISTPGTLCKSNVSYAQDEERFVYKHHPLLVGTGNYNFRINFDTLPEDKGASIVVAISSDKEGSIYKGAYPEGGVDFNLSSMSSLTFLLIENKDNAGKICTLSITATP